MVRDLLELWTMQHFRLARSGSQSGKDTSTDNIAGCTIAAEMKNYSDDSQLNRRSLLGELQEVAISYPNLDLW
ncbi:MAG TPA: hypothetical protein VEJ88_09070, partial [Dissulfurispiraceae bacterium]|nr:hypothetical protein [Dissulfurispiraceae bacterium]